MSTVLYPMPGGGGILARALALNPMTVIIDSYRDVLLRGVLPESSAFLATAALSLGALAASWLAFHRAEFQFAESA